MGGGEHGYSLFDPPGQSFNISASSYRSPRQPKSKKTQLDYRLYHKIWRENKKKDPEFVKIYLERQQVYNRKYKAKLKAAQLSNPSQPLPKSEAQRAREYRARKKLGAQAREERRFQSEVPEPKEFVECQQDPTCHEREEGEIFSNAEEELPCDWDDCFPDYLIEFSEEEVQWPNELQDHEYHMCQLFKIQQGSMVRVVFEVSVGNVVYCYYVKSSASHDLDTH